MTTWDITSVVNQLSDVVTSNIDDWEGQPNGNPCLISSTNQENQRKKGEEIQLMYRIS